MSNYVIFLNDLHTKNLVEFDAIESFWIDRVRDFFAGKPFRLKLDAKKSLRSVVSDLIAQAHKRQADAKGRTDAGAVLQHLVGAKLALAMGPDSIEHHSYSTADASTDRSADFMFGDCAIHVTTAPTEAVIGRCEANLDQGQRPVLVTLAKRTGAALSLGEDAGIGDRLDVFDIEQFLALNIYEWSRFESKERQPKLRDLVNEYNRIVEEYETDPGLKIKI